MMSKGMKSHSYMKGGMSGNETSSAHDGGQTAASMGKGTKSPHTGGAAAQPVKSSGGHMGGKMKY